MDYRKSWTGVVRRCWHGPASKIRGKNNRVIVAMSDAEQAKGQVAEARRTAKKYELNNLVVVVDYNDAQISGKASDIMYVDIKQTISLMDGRL
jgi:transketolase